MRSGAHLLEANKVIAAENTGIPDRQPELTLRRRPAHSLPHDTVQQPTPSSSLKSWQLPTVPCQTNSRAFSQTGEPNRPSLPPIASLPPRASTEDKRSHQSPCFFVFTVAFDEHRMKNSWVLCYTDTENYIMMPQYVIRTVLLPSAGEGMPCMLVCNYSVRALTHPASAFLGHNNGLTADSCPASGPGASSGDPTKLARILLCPVFLS